MGAEFFDGMAAAFGLVAHWLRRGETVTPDVLDAYADAQRAAAAAIRDADQ